MAYLLQLSDGFWLNMDQVALIQHDGTEWRVTIADQRMQITLTQAQAAVLVYYLDRHGQREAYNQTTKHLRPLPPG